MGLTNEKLEEISKYCNSIKDSKPLTKEEEAELAERIKKGDDTAINKLVSANLMYVVRVAKRYTWSNIPIYDLISEGNLGLMRAARKFDPSVGTKFITYADRWIRQAIGEYIKDNAVMNETDDIEDYKYLEDPNGTLGDSVVSDRDVERTKSQFDAVKDLLTCLDKREYEIITKYFGLDDEIEKPLDKISEEMGLTQERVRQIKDTCIEKLQFKAMSSNSYSEYKELY